MLLSFTSPRADTQTDACTDFFVALEAFKATGNNVMSEEWDTLLVAAEKVNEATEDPDAARVEASTHKTATRPSNKTRLQALIGAAKSNAVVAALAITAKASSLRSFGSASPTRPSPLRMKGITGLDTSSACVS